MLRTEANTYDVFYLEESLNYLNEEGKEKESEIDKSVNGTPVSDEIIENSKHRGVIGKIGGIGANSNEPTRNGRRYPLELWQNVEKSEYFVEGMKNRTLIGEADHPQERVDYSISEGAVVLTEYKIQNDGTVYTEFDILDTVAGRTVKTYFDAGCKLGVSSRGLGEEIMKEGEKIIDPDTYQFYCFDVVAFPAVKSARMELLESTSSKKQTLINSITNEIKNCKSIDEVKFIESMSQGVDLYLDEIKEAVEIKKNELNKPIEETFSIAQTDNPEAALDASKELLADLEKLGPNKTERDKVFIDYLKTKIDEYESSKTEGIENLFNQLKEEFNSNDKTKTTIEKNNIKIKSSRPNNKSDEDTPEVLDRDDDKNLEILSELQETVADKDSTIDDLNNSIEQKNKVIKSLLLKLKSQENENQIASDVSTELNESKKQTANLQEKCNSLETDLQSKIEKISSLNNLYSKLQSVNKELSSMVTTLQENYSILESKNDSLNKKLIKFEANANTLTGNINELTESLNLVTKTKNDNENSIKELSKQVSDLKVANESLQKDNEKSKNDLKLSNENIASLKSKYTNSLDKYIESICMQYGLNKQVLLRQLGESYDISKIEKVAKEMFDNISKVNSLPYSNLIPERRIYSENAGLLSNEDNETNELLESFDLMSNINN